MARVAFSIRFPTELAEALDRIAEHGGQSRSDLVETVIVGVDAEDREAIVKTPVVGAPTEKRNLRLSAEALQQLKQLSGDLAPSDFLRRTIAYVVRMVPPEWRQGAAPSGNGHGPASSRMRRGPHARQADAEVGQTHGAAIGLVVVAVLVAFGALVAFIVWLICRRTEPPSPEPGDDRRGQLPPGPAEARGA
jgi:predicted DNA-binding protein